MTAKDEARQRIVELVEGYKLHKPSYEKDTYNEANLRRDFLDPFWEALGWDMQNRQGFAEAYREVVHEDRVKVGGKSKAPDYGFNLVGKHLFYLEAKKPSRNLESDASSAYQLRRYGYSRGSKIGVLTNFAQFAVYDCGPLPDYKDKTTTSRVLFWKVDDYITNFDFLWETFSRQSISRGGLDRWMQSPIFKKGNLPVDEQFLQFLEEWRKVLATEISLRNRDITVEHINIATQYLLDRILFLRMAEDRGLEPYTQLRNSISGDTYENLHQLFDKSNQTYNANLFRKDYVDLTRNLKFQAKLLQELIKSLYPELCPFEFSRIPSDILGSAYERFLGKQIHILPNHSVVIEDKPAVRKAGGVYYTPKYIVDYIVKQTVGKLLEGKTPETVMPLAVIDPACGSGSFLLGAYEFLLKWYTEQYLNGAKPPQGVSDVLRPDGLLIAAEKRRILKAHIYGVDLDPQAVEVAKLNLLLKCLEGENPASVRHQLEAIRQPLLPDMDTNIQCGNSLIGNDVYDLLPTADAATLDKLRPMDWHTAFPAVFRHGGFQAVIGNPPWVQSKFMDSDVKTYFGNQYQTMNGQYDLINGFIEKIPQLTAENGIWGFILPNRFTSNSDYKPLRYFILSNLQLTEIDDMGENVFKNVIMPSTILVGYPTLHTDTQTIVKHSIKDIDSDYATTIVKQQDYLSKGGYYFTTGITPEVQEVLDKMKSEVVIKDLCTNARGVEIGRNHPAVKKTKPETEHHNFLVGADMGRYYIEPKHHYIELSHKEVDYKAPSIYNGSKIIIRKTGHGINATLDTAGFYVIQVIYILKSKEDNAYSLEYILALLNSKAMAFYYFKNFGEMDKKVFPHLKQTQILSLPIKILNLENKPDKEQYDAICKAVTILLQLHKDLWANQLPHEQERIKQRIAHLDTQIDQLVYQLYKLTPTEISLIETTFAT